MPNVEVTTSLAGDKFSYAAGEIVDLEIFAAHVGTGWDALCVPVSDETVDDTTTEVATSPAQPAKPANKRKKGSNA